MKKLIIFGLSMVLALAISCTTGNEPRPKGPTSGTTGSLAWDLSGEGILVIEGNGPMLDYDWSEDIKDYTMPWYSRRNEITSVKIAQGVESIGNWAFRACVNLKSVDIPISVKKVGDHAFVGCERLSAINIPENLQGIGNGAFYGCKNLVNVKIGDNVLKIGEKAFQNCYALQSVAIGSGLEEIGDNAFHMCSALYGVTLPEGLTRIGAGAFAGCSQISEVAIPEGIKKIEDDTFSGCFQLTKVELPERLESIGDRAFIECIGLKNFFLPEGLKVIGNNAFESCINLSEIEFPGNLEIIGNNAFRNCVKFQMITIPPKVKVIGREAFYNCPVLKFVRALGEEPPQDLLEGNFFMKGDSLFVAIGNLDAWSKIEWTEAFDVVTEPIVATTKPYYKEMDFPNETGGTVEFEAVVYFDETSPIVVSGLSAPFSASIDYRTVTVSAVPVLPKENQKRDSIITQNLALTIGNNTRLIPTTMLVPIPKKN